MRSAMSAALVTVAVVAATLGAAPAAHAIEPGGRCTLKAPLTITIVRRAGTIEDTLEPGTLVELISVGDQGGARINVGDVKGNTSMADLESACTGTLKLCTLTAPVMMYEENRSDSKSWRVKVGADVSILKKGKTWAAVRVGDLQGFVKSDEIKGCVARDEAVSAGGAAEGEGELGGANTNIGVDAIERGEGPGVLVLPFVLEGAAPAGAADALLETFYERVSYYRPDAARAPSGPRDLELKRQVVDAAQRAKRGDVAYAIIGRLSVEAPTKEAPLEERYILQLAVVDAKSAKVLKGVRIRPTTKVGDTWAEKVLASLLPAVASAPGSKLPTVTVGPGFEVAKNPGVDDGTAKAPAPAAADGGSTATPWFANAWGYMAFTGAVLAGVGSGVAGVLALDENDRANLAVQTDVTRSDHRNTALAEAITADSLGVVAAGALIGTVVVFATRAGLEP